MMTDSALRTVPAGQARAWWAGFLAISLFWGTYVVVQTPLPAVNEPHYLCKAKHFWQPAYCPGDFFLDSSNTHYVFYATFGCLTKFLSLETTALVGRIIGLGLLAAGWTSLVLRLSNVRWAPIGSAALFLGLTSWQNFSGEWIVGGIESKVIAYGCLFFSWSLLCDRRWKGSAVLLGAAISFHPVVGIWSVASTLIALSILLLNQQTRTWLPARRDFIISGILLALFALPGLIPALAALRSPVPNVAQADRLQVFERLGHHLNPMQFSRRAYLVYAVLLAVWMGSLWFRKRAGSAENGVAGYRNGLWTGIVAGSILIALAGLAIGWLESKHDLDLLVKLMKFYPFRLADVLLPMATAVSLIELTGLRHRIAEWLTPTVVLGCLFLGGVALMLEMPSRNPEGYSSARRSSWIDICGWVDENLPADAMVLAPTSSTTFRWYASRAVYVTFKDCPQDAAGLLEWNRRIKLYKAWASRSYEDDESFSAADLGELAELTGASYLVTRRMGPMEIEPIHRNRFYRVYRLPQSKQVAE